MNSRMIEVELSRHSHPMQDRPLTVAPPLHSRRSNCCCRSGRPHRCSSGMSVSCSRLRLTVIRMTRSLMRKRKKIHSNRSASLPLAVRLWIICRASAPISTSNRHCMPSSLDWVSMAWVTMKMRARRV